MALASSSRNGARIIWVCLHTAEGSRRRSDLFSFFDTVRSGSSHGGADGTGLDDGWVPDDRAAWTLLNGNSRSLNLEMCGFARWTREQWLSTGTVDGVVNPRQMIRNAAEWVRRKCDKYGIPKQHIGSAGVAAGRPGVIMHWDYTIGARDGDHTDIGSNFPWDVLWADVAGINSLEDDMPLTPNDGNVRWRAANPFTGQVEEHPLATWIGLGTYYGLYAYRELAALKGLVTGFTELVKQAVADDRDIDMAAIEAAAERGAREGTAESLKALPVEVEINLAGDRDTTN